MIPLDTSRMFYDGSPSAYLSSLNQSFWLPFMQSLIKTLTANQQADWYVDAILREDIRLLNNGQDFYMVLSADDLSLMLQPNDLTEDCLKHGQIPSLQDVLDTADTAACAKILRFRISQSSRMKSLFYPLSELRNVSSHQKIDGSDDDEKYLNTIRQMRKNLRNLRNVKDVICITGADSTAVQAVLDEYLPELDKLIADLSLFFPRFSIDRKRKEPLLAKHLSFCTVIADEFALMQKNSDFRLDELLCHGKITVFRSTVNALREMASNAQRSEPERRGYSKVLKILSDGEKIGRVTVLNNRSDSEETTGSILAYVKESDDSSLCVWTDALSLPEMLYARGKPKLAVIRGFERLNWIVVDPAQLQQTAALPDREPVQTKVPTIRFRTEQPEPNPAPQSITLMPEVTYAPQRMVQPAYSAPFMMPKPMDMVYFDPDQKDGYTLTEELASGGEGVIFENKEKGGSYLFKIYKPERLTEERIHKITAMVNEKRIAEEYPQICWPRNLLYDKMGRVIGYAMDPVRNAVSVKDIVCTLLDGHYEKSSFPWTTRSALVQLCINIADRFKQLHDLGTDAAGQRVLMGDVNPDNILVSKENGTVWFIDVDSYQFREYNCPVGTPEFSSLRLVEEFHRHGRKYAEIERTLTDEKFAMSMLYFYILFPKQSPYRTGGGSMADAIREGKFIFANDDVGMTKYAFAWKNLTEEVRTKFRKTFGKVAGQSMQYSDAAEWSGAFRDLALDISGPRPGHIKLSDRIWPSCCLQNAGETFREETCYYCGETFEVPGNAARDSREACPECKRKIGAFRAIIYEKTCRKCGRRFSVNKFDLAQSDCCPDCDPNAHYAKLHELEGDGAEESISKMLTYAVRNYLEE